MLHESEVSRPHVACPPVYPRLSSILAKLVLQLREMLARDVHRTSTFWARPWVTSWLATYLSVEVADLCRLYAVAGVAGVA